jgi:hypothetical protein
MPRSRKTDLDWSLDVDEITLADGARAAEIALMEKIGLPEFGELTGKGIGIHGIYRVDQAGVSLRVSDGLATLTDVQQQMVNQAARRLTLRFTCTPAQFMAWYDATRGEKDPLGKGKPGVSDFPLAAGFVEALEQNSPSNATAIRDSVVSGRIVDAFRMSADDAENRKWWKERMGHAGRYKLDDARVSRGRADNPSRWDPLQIAIWLEGKGHLPPEKVRRAFEAHFPKLDSTLL